PGDALRLNTVYLRTASRHYPDRRHLRVATIRPEPNYYGISAVQARLMPRPDMNCDLPVYREAYKLFEGTPREVWSVLWLFERYVNGAIAQIDRIRDT